MYTLTKGIIESIILKQKRKGNALFLGIDGAGKTTVIEEILEIIYPERKKKTVRPTYGFNTEKLYKGNYMINLWDISGKKDFRNLWAEYIKDAQMIVYVINMDQEDRIHESRKLLDQITLDYRVPTAIVFVNAKGDPSDIVPMALAVPTFYSSDLSELIEWIKNNTQFN